MSFYFHHCLLCLLTTGTFDYSELADIETFNFADFKQFRALLFLLLAFLSFFSQIKLPTQTIGSFSPLSVSPLSIYYVSLFLQKILTLFHGFFGHLQPLGLSFHPLGLSFHIFLLVCFFCFFHFFYNFFYCIIKRNYFPMKFQKQLTVLLFLLYVKE